MRGTSRREDAAFWVIRLDEVQSEHREGARFLSRFTKDRNSPSEQAAIEWRIATKDGKVEIETHEASSMDVFRQWVEDGLTRAEDIAHEMGVSKGTVSKLAKRAMMPAGWIKKEGTMRWCRALVSKIAPIGRKRETKGNETGNELETKRGFLCKTENREETRNGNEGGFFERCSFPSFPSGFSNFPTIDSIGNARCTLFRGKRNR
jgi:hypothetical protein